MVRKDHSWSEFRTAAMLLETFLALLLALLNPATSAAQATMKGTDSRAYFEYEVERPAAIDRASAAPKYPVALKREHIEGLVLVQFVVDATGSVELKSVVVRQATNALFVNEVRAALAERRYTPAELDGRKVRQVVQQRFTFHAPK